MICREATHAATRLASAGLYNAPTDPTISIACSQDMCEQPYNLTVCDGLNEVKNGSQ